MFLIVDYLSIIVIFVFLGFLFVNLFKIVYMFVCNLGGWIGVFFFLVVVFMVESIVVIGFSMWVIYGSMVGIFCMIMLVFVVWLFMMVVNVFGSVVVVVDVLD